MSLDPLQLTAVLTPVGQLTASLQATGPEGPPGPAGAHGTPTTIADEGVALAEFDILNFIGAGVSAAVDIPNNRINVTIPGGGSQTPWTQNIDGAGFDLLNAGRLQTAGDTASLGNTGSAILVREVNRAGTVAPEYAPRIAFFWSGHAAAQIGLLYGAGETIRTFNDAGTGYAPFACGPITVNGIATLGRTAITDARTGIGSSLSQLRIISPGGGDSPPGINFFHGGVQSAQLVLESGALRVRDDAGTAFAPFACAALTANGDCNITGSYRVNGVVLAQTPWTGNVDAAGFSLSNTGDVGIGGATSPPFKLNVTGDILLSGYVYGGGVSVTNVYGSALVSAPLVNCTNILTVDTAVNASADIQLSSGGLTRWTMRKGGGETGSGNTGADYTIMRHADNGAYIADALAITRSTGNLGLPTPHATYKLNVTGDVNITGSYRVNGVVQAQTPWTGNVDAATWALLNVSNAVFSGYVDLGGPLNLGATSRQATLWTVMDGATNSGAVTISTRNLGTIAECMRIKANGDVGIGTSTPQERLHVESASPVVIRQSVPATRGMLHYFDGTDYFVLFTASGDPHGTITGLRPMQINAASGMVTHGSGLDVTGGTIRLFLGGSLKTLSVDGSGFVKAA